MHYVNLGRTGLKVSALCLGTMTFGYQCDEAQSFAILDAALGGGIDFIDTADMYPIGGGLPVAGRTEEIIGKWLKGRREEVVLATKCTAPMGPKPFHRGSSKKHVLTSIDASLKRLQTDYIDLYQLHMYDPETPLDEALEALDLVVKSGKARYVGVSNWPAYKVARALGRSEVKNISRIDSVQPRYNLLFRNFELDLLPLCEEEGIGVIPYNPLAGGFLTGKHKRTGPPTEGTRFTLGSAAGLYQGRYWHEHQFDVVEEIVRLAGEAGMTPATLAVAWVMANPAITSPIVGASKPEQLTDSLKAAELGPVPADLKAKLDELTYAWRRVDETR